MGFPTKVQLILRKDSQQWNINFPSAIAEAMESATRCPACSVLPGNSFATGPLLIVSLSESASTRRLCGVSP
jgi:hypothetical protein